MTERAEQPTNDAWRCPNCLYSLRGMHKDPITCPECGETYTAKQLDDHISEEDDPDFDALLNCFTLGGVFAIALFLSVALFSYDPTTAPWLLALGACGFAYTCFKYNRLADERERKWAFYLYTQLGICLLLAVLTGGFFAIEWASSTLSAHWGVSKQWLSLLLVITTGAPCAVAFLRILLWWLIRFAKFYNRS